MKKRKLTHTNKLLFWKCHFPVFFPSPDVENQLFWTYYFALVFKLAPKANIEEKNLQEKSSIN